MKKVSPAMRGKVILRAGDRCEYCRLAQQGQEATFHIDHIFPRAVGGKTVLGNLALACVSCSLRKGARTHALDPDTGKDVAIFHPRMDTWDDHFKWQGLRIVGKTPSAKATVSLLKLNRRILLEMRLEAKLLGRHPPL